MQDGLALVYLFAGRYDDAIGAEEKALALDSSSAGPYGWLGLAYAMQGRDREAVEFLKKCGFWCQGLLGYVYGVMGRRAEARKLLDALKARREERDWSGRVGGLIATIHVGLGEREQALDWLERTIQPGAWDFFLSVDPRFRSLHAEPRFQALLKKMRLED